MVDNPAGLLSSLGSAIKELLLVLLALLLLGYLLDLILRFKAFLTLRYSRKWQLSRQLDALAASVQQLPAQEAKARARELLLLPNSEHPHWSVTRGPVPHLQVNPALGPSLRDFFAEFRQVDAGEAGFLDRDSIGPAAPLESAESYIRLGRAYEGESLVTLPGEDAVWEITDAFSLEEQAEDMEERFRYPSIYHWLVWLRESQMLRTRR